MSMSSIPGFISKLSPHSVPETIQRLSALLKSKGVAIFALIDHSGEAEKAGLKMRPTQLLIFGNPKRGPAPDARRSQHRHRPATQGARLGRRGRQSLAKLQFA